MNIPLVSEYKIPFILHRISQTFFGGLELGSSFGSSSTESTLPQTLFRLAIYLFPGVLGIATVALIDNAIVDGNIGVFFVILFNLFFVSLIHFIESIPYKRADVNFDFGNKPNFSSTSPQHLLGPIGSSSVAVSVGVGTLVHHRSIGSILLYATISATLLGLMTHTFKWSHVTAAIVGPEAEIEYDSHTTLITAIIIFAMAWFTLLVTHHSLTLGPAPETAAYSMTFNRADAFNRPAHLLVCLAALAAIPDRYITMRRSLIGIQCSMPFLWLLGVVPPVQSLLHYLLEQVNARLFGGTANCSIISLFSGVLVCAGGCLSAHHFLRDGEHFLLVCAVIAFAASGKWIFDWRQASQSLMASKTLATAAFGTIIGAFYIPGSAIHAADYTLLCVAATLLIAISVVRHLHRIYLVNLIKNPLAAYIMSSSSSSLLSVRFKQSNEMCIVAARIVLYFVLPPISLLLVRNRLSSPDISARLGQTSATPMMLNVLVFRLLRQVWQTPYTFALQIMLISMLENWFATNAIARWPIELKHFALSFAIDVTVNFARKLYLELVIMWSSIFLKKQRLAYSGLLFVLNLIISPLNIVVLCIASVLNAPILPLFTLPIFLLSFPRPLQFWSTTPTHLQPSANDAAYYQQILPRLIQSLRKQRLFWDFCKAGEFLLARYEDRLMWIQVLEAGYCYAMIQMKGLELQETSCHAIEASLIDHLIEMAFGDEHRSISANAHSLYTISPMTKVSVRTYSDAKNVLTGIIDSPDTYFHIKAIFCPVLIWTLLKQQISENNRTVTSTITSANKRTNSSIEKAKKNAVNDIESAIQQQQQQQQEQLPRLTFESLRPSVWSNNAYQYLKQRGPNNQAAATSATGTNGFSVEWFREAIRVLTNDRCHLNDDELQSLKLTYGAIANACYGLVFPVNYATEVPTTSQSIFQMFNGEIYATEDSERQFVESNPDLYAACVTAFQYSAKITFDRMIFATDSVTIVELATILQDYDRNWHFGSRASKLWCDAVNAEKGNLFAVGKDMVKENYTSHLLTLQEMDVYVCSLNRSTIEAIWSSLSLELFYLTNDDEERYSIQAHPIILRNLTVQAADPPLGYPVFTSKPTIINHLVYE